MELSKRFEQLVRRYFEINAFQVEEEIGDQTHDAGIDLIVRVGEVKFAVVVKYYRSLTTQSSLIAAALKSLSEVSSRASLRPLLVLSSRLHPDQRIALEEKFGITIIDAADLLVGSRSEPDLNTEFFSLFELQGELENGEDPEKRVAEAKNRKVSKNLRRSRDGENLCDELANIECGKYGWVNYERWSTRALKYLFEHDLTGWQEQQRTDDGLSRFDLICRVRDTTDFWRFLATHFQSRYLLFEFKNHCKEIGPGEVLTTERYLFENGLRRVAIILARKGANDQAKSMSKGALREGGKLIVILSDSCICKMLKMRDVGSDPSDYLYDVVDEILMSLSR